MNSPKRIVKTRSKQALRLGLITSAMLLSVACQASSEVQTHTLHEAKMDESNKTIKQTKDCPLISSNNWQAQIVSIDGQRQLKLNGDIELPNPGFAVTFNAGIADRSLRPIQHFHINFERLSGFHIQTITPMNLEHLSPAVTPQYKSIIIHCGEQIIATIDKVTEG